MRAFGGPERAEIGWEQVRAAWSAGPRNGRPTPWDAWAGESERVPLSRKQDGVRVPDFEAGIMEPYNLLEDLLTSCDCHNNGEQPKEVGDDCGDGYVDEVYGWEYYGGNCWFKYRCRDKDKCRCHSLEEALSAAGYRLSDLDDSIGHGACSAKYPGRVEKPGWALCGGRNARLVWDAETESCAVELDCFPDQSATDACDVDGSARINLGALTKCTVGSRTTEYWPIHKGVCDDLVDVGSMRTPRVEDIANQSDCTIEARARVVQESRDVFPIYHTFVAYTDRNGMLVELQGRPQHEFELPDAIGCNGFGTLNVDVNGRIRPSKFDDSIVIDSTPLACGYIPCLENQAKRIDDRGLCYNLRGPNSNSATYSILLGCGLVPDSPKGHPVWGWEIEV